MKRTAWLHFIAVLSGIAASIGVSQMTGRREAWDSEAYFVYVIPVSCVLAFVLACIEPQRAWRWGFLQFMGQLLALLFSAASFGLLPLGLIAFAVLSVPAILAAKAGAALRARFKEAR